MSGPGLSVVVIAFDEEEYIERVTVEARDALVRAGISAEIVLVDDGSTDATGRTMEALATRFANEAPAVRTVRLPRNTGIGGALRAGFEASRGDWIVWIPGDGQIPPEAVLALWEAREGAALTTTEYVDRPDGWLRRAVSFGFNVLIRARTGEPTKSGGNYIVRRQAWIDAALPPDDTMIFSTALRARLRERGDPIATIRIRGRARLAGHSKVLNLRTLWRTLQALVRLPGGRRRARLGRIARLGLPLRHPGLAWTVALALGALYAATIERDLGWFDGPLLGLAAVRLGLAHPPGQPLHTIFAHLLSVATARAPLVGCALASAIPAALSAIPATALVERLAPLDGRPSRFLAGTILFGLGAQPLVWDAAARIEVYALATFLGLWHVALAFTHDAPSPRRAAGAGLLLGLCASVNPYVAVASGVCSLGRLLSPRLAFAFGARVRDFGAALGGAIAGLAPYAYLPLVARTHDRLVWGEPSTFARLAFYLAGRDYGGHQHGGAALRHLGAAARLLLSGGLVAAVILGAGAWLATARRRAGGVAALAPLLVGLFVVASNDPFLAANPDYGGYLALGIWVLGAGFAATLVRIERLPVARAALAAAWLVGSLLGRPTLADRVARPQRTARRLATIALAEAPPHAIVLLESDHLVFPTMYLQEVEAQRPDVTILNVGWASSSWYWALLRRRDPTLPPIDPGARTRIDRIERFLRAAAKRPVVAEHLALAALAGRPVCRGGLFAWSGDVCRTDDVREAIERRVAIRNTIDRYVAAALRDPMDVRVLSYTALRAGDDDRLSGDPAGAFMSYVAAVPSRDRAGLPRPDLDLLDPRDAARVPRRPHTHSPRTSRFLADPAENLRAAAEVLEALGDPSASLYRARAASLAGGSIE